MSDLHTFFGENYVTLYKQVGTVGALNQSIKNIEDSLNTLNKEISEISKLVDALDGSFSSELMESINSISAEILASVEIISQKYPKVVNALNELLTDLNEFDHQDQVYTLEYSNYNYSCELQENANKYEKDKKTGEDVISWFWQQLEDDKNEAFEKYTEAKKKIDELIGRIDSNLEIIKEFNNSIAEVRMKTSAIMYSTGGKTANEIENMTLEEKEAFIQNIIDNMTKDYYSYVETYKSILEKYENDNDLFISHMALFSSMTGIYIEQIDSLSDVNRINIIFSLSDFVDLVLDTKASNGKNPFECLELYLNGTSFKESGLYELYLNSNDIGDLWNHFTLTDDQIENFWKEKIYGICSSFFNEGEEFEDFLNREIKEFGELINDINTFKENYFNACDVGASIITLKEYRKHIKYDEVRSILESGEYELKYTPEQLKENFVDLGYYEDVDAINYMSIDEARTLNYIFETEGKQAARDFVSSLQGAINRRKGYTIAYDTYYQAMNGDNATWENIKMYFIGAGDGLRQFGDGLVDVFAPTTVISAEDYANIYLLELLSDDKTVRSLMMRGAYAGGNASATYGTSALLNYCLPGLGSGLKAISTYGNAKESTLQHNSLDEVVYSGNIDDIQYTNDTKYATKSVLAVAGRLLYEAYKNPGFLAIDIFKNCRISFSDIIGLIKQ